MFDVIEEYLEKANAKGLSKWDKLQHIAATLDGKTSADITFTAVNPDGSTTKHVLGSKEGNLKFLMGYGNPAFYMAPYHWSIIDPNLSEDEAKQFYKEKGHPSNPQFWEAHGLPLTPEGDLKEGKPHPSIKPEKEPVEDTDGTLTVIDKYGVYVADPENGFIEGLHNQQTYDWSLVKDTYFSAVHTDVTEAMESAAGSLTKSTLQEYAYAFRGHDWDEDVYPIVRSHFPRPGSIVPLTKGLVGVMSSTSVDFFTEDGAPTELEVLDTSVPCLQLRKSDSTFASVILTFADKFIKSIDVNELAVFEHKECPWDIA